MSSDIQKKLLLSEKICAVGFEAWVGPALADSWHSGRRAQQGQSLERVCPEAARVQPLSVPWSVDVARWLLCVWPQCTLWLAAASSSLPFPGTAKLLHTFQTLPCGVSSPLIPVSGQPPGQGPCGPCPQNSGTAICHDHRLELLPGVESSKAPRLRTHGTCPHLSLSTVGQAQGLPSRPPLFRQSSTKQDYVLAQTVASECLQACCTWK